MTIALGRDVAVTDVEDGVVLLDQRRGRYWRLNPTGAAALRLLLAGRTAEEAAADLARRYPDADDRAETDVRTLLDALRAARLVVTS